MRKKYIVYIYELCPFPLYLLAELITYKFPQFIQQQGYMLVEEFKNRTMRASGDLKVSDKWSSHLIKKIERNQKWIKRVIKEYFYYMRDLHGYLKAINRMNLKNKTNKQLWQFLDGFIKRYNTMYLRGWVPNAIEGHQNNFSKYLTDYLKKRLDEIGRGKDVGEYFSILTMSFKKFPRQNEQNDFLDLVNSIWKNRNLKNKFIKLPVEDIINFLEKKYKRLDEKINKHIKKYIWLSWKYEGPGWDKFYFVGLIKDFLKGNLSPAERLEQIEKARKESIEKQQIYTKEIHLDKDRKFNSLFKLAREIMYLKEHQKDFLFQCYYFLCFIVNEAAARLKLSPDQFRYLLHHEMEKALLQNHYSQEELNERRKNVVLVMRRGKQIQILTGIKASKYAKISFPPLPKLKLFYGQSACSGHVKGRVNIIQEMKDMSKMKQGDILVTTRTNPNLLPAIRKAAAIVADIGGVGSHAAIVSRELGIPAVVGADLASAILKDGDWVEVDADKGIVRKLK